MMKIFLLCCFSLCSVLASASTLEWCLDHFPHRHFYPDNSAPHGPTVDLIQELSKRTGFTITYSTNTPFPRCLQHLKQGKSDLMTSLNYSAARAEFMYLLPYDKARVEVLYQRKNAVPLKSWTELSNQQLGMVRGYVYNAALLEKLTVQNQVEVSSLDIGFAMLLTGRIDSLIAPAQQALNVIDSNPRYKSQFQPAVLQFQPAEDRFVYLGLSKKTVSEQQKQQIEDALQTMVQDGLFDHFHHNIKRAKD
jgi:ABC-type amino acid transport substrate-binding protein